MKRKVWILIAAVAIGGGAAVWLTQRSDAGTEQKNGSLRVTLAPKDLVIEVVDTGKVQPKERIEVKSKVAGQVTAVHVNEGDFVKTGALLLKLDPIDYQREVTRADAEVAQAKNALEFAELDLKRKQQAQKDRAVAQIDVDLAANEVKTKEIGKRMAEIALATARDRLRYTALEAPIDGTVLELGIKQGEVVTPGVQQTFEGRPLLTIGDLSSLIVKVELNQIDIAKVALEQKVKLTFDAVPKKSFDAVVTKTAPSAVKPKGKEVEVFVVEATLVEVDPVIRPGMTADVRFQVETLPNVLSVPIEAVRKEDGKSWVTKIVPAEKGEKNERVEVNVGARNDREVEITSGLVAGDVILIDPASAKENEVEL